MTITFDTFAWLQEMWPEAQDIQQDYTEYVKNAMDFYLTCGVAVDGDSMKDAMKARRELTKMYMIYRGSEGMISRALKEIGDFYMMLVESNVIVESKAGHTYMGTRNKEGLLTRTFICACGVIDMISFYRIYTLMCSMNISCRPEILKDVDMTDFDEILEDDSWQGTIINYF